MDQCDVYFEDSLISKERLIQTYAEFFASAFDKSSHSLLIAQHTGSVCFDAMSFLIAALGCLALNDTPHDNVIASFKDGDMALWFGDRKQERWLWGGFAKSINGSDYVSADFDDAEYAVLEQPSKHSTKYYVPRNLWNRIAPYKGDATRTDGRGIRRTQSHRNDFISYVFEVPSASIPSVLGVSTVIVADTEAAKRMVHGVRVNYGESKSIGLLDLVTASYYTSNLEEHQYGTNPAKTEPNLKITSRISAARDLVLDKSGNKTVGFMVMGTDSIIRGNSELLDLLERKSLNFSMLATSIDSEVAQEILEAKPDASPFVCTKEFLLHHSELPKVKNPLTAELDCQIENICSNEVSPVVVEGVCSWQKIKAMKNALWAIRHSDISSEEKDNFIVTAFALTNLALTALFPLQRLNTALEHGELISRASTPSVKRHMLRELAKKATTLGDEFLVVADVVDDLYHSVFATCPKYDALMDLLGQYVGQRIALVVPKSYSVDILKVDDAVRSQCAAIVTANRFNHSESYDVVIVAGDFATPRFNPLKCRSASDIFVLLYDGEAGSFRYKQRKAAALEKAMNARLGLNTDENDDDEPVEHDEIDEVQSVTAQDGELEQYIDAITAFDASAFARKISGYSGDDPSTEAYAFGRFLSDERILFTRYYHAVVFDPAGGTVVEKDVDSLNPHDILVFFKRDNHTKNMVDDIYDQLQQTGRFSDTLIDATEKSRYWKMVLREYKNNHGLSYHDVAQQLRTYGLSIQEVSVRQWLIEESHIIGPREENTLIQIANLTKDPLLLKNPHAYFEACEIVRKQRKNILKLIGKAIVNKLSGHASADDPLLESIFENVENLSETLELDEVSILDKPVSLPATFTNRPINNMEGTL